MLAFSLTACDSEKVLNESEIPTEISAFVATHFPEHEILQVIKDVEGLTTDYDVTLNNGVSLSFDKSREVKDIDSNTKLPDGVIPVKLRDYVEANYPGHVITDWELTDRRQQISLDNGLDLEFDMDGAFKRIDD